jgi:hypothetical protein
VVQLLAELESFRNRPEEHPIRDVRGLAATIAHRACSRWMRRQFPERHAFKNRLYYLLTRQRGFALWQNEKRKLIAGFSVWRGREDVAAQYRLQRISEDEGLVLQLSSLQVGHRQAEVGGVLAAIFDRVAGPVEFDRLVGFLGVMLRLNRAPIEPPARDGDVGLAAAAGPDTAWRVEKRIFLQRLWQELCQLPRHQRAALLLNLRDDHGGGCIALFPATGVATLRQLADAIGMSADEFAALWNDLPLEDRKIATVLHLTRQQVINARKSARERLARRLKGFL